jgi:hypothetical protein
MRLYWFWSLIQMPVKKTEKGRMKEREIFQLVPALTLQRKNTKYRYHECIHGYFSMTKKLFYPAWALHGAATLKSGTYM